MPIDVASSIKFTATDTEPTSDKGNVYYDNSESVLKHYDGSNWVGVDTTNPNTIGADGHPGEGQYLADSYTKLLIHSHSTNGSTTFVDSSPSGHTVVTNGDPSHSTAQAKFGSTSIHCDDTADGLGAAAHADFNLGTGDWTLDFWWYPTSIEAENYFLNTNSSWTMLCLYYASGFKVLHNNPSPWQTSVEGGAGELTANVWQHLAYVRASNVITIYLDGAIVAGPTTDTRAFTSGTTTLNASSYMAGNFTGYIDEYRLSVGIARWTSAFTVY
jgi:hypothetical protein